MKRTNKPEPIPLRFELYREGERGVSFHDIAKPVIKIGSDEKSDIVVEGVGRIHAVIEPVRKDEILLIDLGNEPGTAVNGDRIHKRLLVVGDKIMIGKTLIVLVRVGDESKPWPESKPVGDEADALLEKIRALEEKMSEVHRTLRPIQDELEQSRKALGEARIKRAWENQVLVKKALAAFPDLVNILSPKHTHTNCDDTDPQNDRCPRCVVVRLSRDEYCDPSEFELVIRPTG